MNPFEFVLVIILAGIGYNIWKTKHLSRHGSYEDQEGKVHRLDSGREAELQREVEELRERVKVLERIATDDRESRLLSDEIDKLRDK